MPRDLRGLLLEEMQMNEPASGSAILKQAKPSTRDAELASPFVSELTQLLLIVIELAQAANDREEIEHRLGKNPRN